MWIIEASAPTDDAVQAAGLAVFWGRDSRTYLAPFEVAATLTPDRRSLASYELRFGVRGERTRLALVPYTQESIVRSRMFMFRPRRRRDWAFVVIG